MLSRKHTTYTPYFPPKHVLLLQSALVLDSLRLATDFLRPEGTFVTKIFRSRDYTALLYAFRQLFARVDATKPQASRATSAEIFVVCSGYKAPGKIDPRLLDHRSLFQVCAFDFCSCLRTCYISDDVNLSVVRFKSLPFSAIHTCTATYTSP